MVRWSEQVEYTQSDEINMQINLFEEIFVFRRFPTVNLYCIPVNPKIEQIKLT